MAKTAARNPHAEIAMLDPAPVNCSIPETSPVDASGTNDSVAPTMPEASLAATGVPEAAGSATTAAALLPPNQDPHPLLLLPKLNPKFLFYLYCHW